MKKLILSLALAAALVPVVAFADHLQGTFGSWGKDHLTVTDPAHKNQQVRFSHGGTIPFVDDHGATVNHTTLKAGHPVTVEYSGTGDHRTASRVVVHKQTTTTTTPGH
jgi:hypothetical protein